MIPPGYALYFLFRHQTSPAHISAGANGQCVSVKHCMGRGWRVVTEGGSGGGGGLGAVAFCTRLGSTSEVCCGTTFRYVSPYWVARIGQCMASCNRYPSPRRPPVIFHAAIISPHLAVITNPLFFAHNCPLVSSRSPRAGLRQRGGGKHAKHANQATICTTTWRQHPTTAEGAFSF